MEAQNGYPWYHPFIGGFHADDMGVFLFDKSEQMVSRTQKGAFWDYDDREMFNKVLADVCNGTDPLPHFVSTLKKLFPNEFVPSQADVYTTLAGGEKVRIMCIRGWGYMTGSLKMSAKDAAAAQDTICREMVRRLNAVFREVKVEKSE